MRSTILPVHATTGLRAIGIVGGKPVWPVMGAQDPPPDDQPAAPKPAPPAPEPDPEDDKDWKAEAEKWKALSRKHEDGAKKNADTVRELEKFRQQHLTEQEKAVLAAKDEARAEVLAEVGGRLVEAAFTAATAGRLDDSRRDALLEGIDLQRFITAEGDADRDAIKAFVDRVVGEAAPDPRGLGQGRRPTPKASGVQSGRELFEQRKKKTPAIS